MRKKSFLLLVAGLLAVSLSVFAQVAVRTGAIYGKVVDKDGAALPGVTVTLESEVIPSQVVTSGSTGIFRFPAVPPGVYSLTFSIQGYTELRQEDVRVNTGGEVQLDIKMNQTPGEQFTVIADAPTVDTKKTGVDQTFNSEYLKEVPNARDPWVIADQASGLDVDRYNVAGSESGQQASFIARGGSDDNTVWNLDGVNTTDVVAFGASPDYYDFDAFEEVNISTAGNDVSIPTGGVAINIVTKRGGNKVQGDADYYFVSDSLQSDNLPAEAAAQGAAGSNRIDQIKDYGFNLGGPIIKDKLFAWGAIRKNNIGLFNTANQLDSTDLTSYNFKLNYNFNASNEFQFGYFNNDKTKTGRASFPGQQETDTLWNQGGAQTILEGDWSFQQTWIPNDHTFVTGRYGYIGNGFSLIPPAGKDVPIIFDLAIPRVESTWLTVAPVDRPAHDVSIDTNLFKEKWAGGDHEFKFGFEYKTVDWISGTYYGNGQFISDYYNTQVGGPLTSGYLQIYLPLQGKTRLNRTSFYAQDTYRKGRLTANLGVRYDRNWGINQGVDRPTVTGFENLIQAFQFDGNDPKQVFNDFSPRVGVTYDVSGNGKTIVRGNFARYYDIYNAYIPYHTHPGFAPAYVGFTYTNLNGDREITPNELTSDPTYNGAISGPAFDYNDFLSRRQYDPNLHNSGVNEYLAGFEQELFRDVSVSATYTHRDYFDPTVQLPEISPEDFQRGADFVQDTVLGTFTVPFYNFVGNNNGKLIYGNVQDVKQSYNGLDLNIAKRMSNNFLMNGSLVIQRTHQKFTSPLGTGFLPSESLSNRAFWSYDPTNAQYTNDRPYAISPGGGGKAQVYPYSEWQLKMSGVYKWPWQLSTGVFVRYQQGYPDRKSVV